MSSPQPLSDRRKRRPRRSRSGSTLVELIGAALVTAMVLVPSMQLLHRSHEVVHRLDLHTTMEHLAASEVHLRIARLTAAFTSTQYSGDFASHGHADCRFTTVCSDTLVDGGEPGQLMAIVTVVWHDADGDGVRQDAEASLMLATKYAKGPDG